MTINNNSANETQEPNFTKPQSYNLHVSVIKDQEDTIIPTVEICRPTPSSSPKPDSPMVYDLNYLHPNPPQVLDKTLHERKDSLGSIESDLDLDCNDSQCKVVLVNYVIDMKTFSIFRGIHGRTDCSLAFVHPCKHCTVLVGHHRHFHCNIFKVLKNSKLDIE